jgi:hypothetical protein
MNNLYEWKVVRTMQQHDLERDLNLLCKSGYEIYNIFSVDLYFIIVARKTTIGCHTISNSKQYG